MTPMGASLALRCDSGTDSGSGSGSGLPQGVPADAERDRPQQRQPPPLVRARAYVLLVTVALALAGANVLVLEGLVARAPPPPRALTRAAANNAVRAPTPPTPRPLSAVPRGGGGRGGSSASRPHAHAHTPHGVRTREAALLAARLADAIRNWSLPASADPHAEVPWHESFRRVLELERQDRAMPEHPRLRVALVTVDHMLYPSSLRRAVSSSADPRTVVIRHRTFRDIWERTKALELEIARSPSRDRTAERRWLERRKELYVGTKGLAGVDKIWLGFILAWEADLLMLNGTEAEVEIVAEYDVLVLATHRYIPPLPARPRASRQVRLFLPSEPGSVALSGGDGCVVSRCLPRDFCPVVLDAFLIPAERWHADFRGGAVFATLPLWAPLAVRELAEVFGPRVAASAKRKVYYNGLGHSFTVLLFKEEQYSWPNASRHMTALGFEEVQRFGHIWDYFRGLGRMRYVFIGPIRRLSTGTVVADAAALGAVVFGHRLRAYSRVVLPPFLVVDSPQELAEKVDLLESDASLRDRLQQRVLEAANEFLEYDNFPSAWQVLQRIRYAAPIGSSSRCQLDVTGLNR